MPAPYLTWLAIFVILPTVILWLFEWRLLWYYRRVFLVVIAFVLVFGISWDLMAVTLHIWDWPKECCDLWAGPLPLEELLFMLFVPMFFVSLTLVLRQIVQHHRSRR